tara:strand:- start:45592 stop:46176 length:585 start_codon:yes stop_codon:yes gene_type:complete
MNNLTNKDIEHVILRLKKIYPCFPKIKITENITTKKKITVDQTEKDLIIINKNNCCSENKLMRNLLHVYIINFAFDNITENNKEDLLLKIYSYFDEKGIINDLKNEYAFSELKNSKVRCEIVKNKIAYLSENQILNRKTKLSKIKNDLKCKLFQLKENLLIADINDKVFLLIDNINLKIEQENKRVNVRFHSFR